MGRLLLWMRLSSDSGSIFSSELSALPALAKGKMLRFRRLQLLSLLQVIEFAEIQHDSESLPREAHRFRLRLRLRFKYPDIPGSRAGSGENVPAPSGSGSAPLPHSDVSSSFCSVRYMECIGIIGKDTW